jgi:hypothetical protein
MWLGTDWPAQCKPHSSTQRRRSASEVWVTSKTTVAVWETGLASTRSAPGRRPSTASTTAFSEPRRMGRTSRTTVARFGWVIRRLRVCRRCSGTSRAVADGHLLA